MQHRLRRNTRGGHRAKVKFSNNITQCFQTVLSQNHLTPTEERDSGSRKELSHWADYANYVHVHMCTSEPLDTNWRAESGTQRDSRERRARSFFPSSSRVSHLRCNKDPNQLFPQNTGPQHNSIYCHLLLGRVKKNPSFPPCSRVSHLRCNKDPTQLFSSKHRTST